MNYRYVCMFLTVLFIVGMYSIPAFAANEKPLGGAPLDLRQPGNQVEWNARWIENPLFRNLPFRFLYRQEEEKDVSGVEEGDPKNIHTLYRKTFRVKDRPIQSAKLYITADDVYKLYLNESFIGLGPSPAYLFAYAYNGWDVKKNLAAGENCLAAHVYYQGEVNRVWGSGDNLQGLLAQLEIVYENGDKEIIITDGSWKNHQTHAYDSGRTLGYKTQYAEDIDLRKLDPDWKNVNFDDSGWNTPYVEGNPVPPQYTLDAQITPPLAVKKVWPEKVIEKEPGRYFIDFGTELAGMTCFRVTGPAGHKVEIRHGEELSGPNEVRHDMRANMKYQEFITLAGREDDTIEFFDYKGFRYVEVLNWPEKLNKEDVWVRNRHYPFDESACEFSSSNPLLNDIWQLCKNGVKQGTQDTYLDCPTREKGGYLGDAYVTGQSHLYLTGDTRVLKKTLRDFAHSARICPGLMAVAPGNFMQEIADYSLLWPIILERYYMWSGDKAFVEEMIPILDGLLGWFAQYENPDGLLEAVKEKWNLVDWPKNLRDGYDYERAEQGINTVLNHFYYGCLHSAIRLYNIAGCEEKADAMGKKAEIHKKAAQEQLVNAKKGIFVDAAGSEHSSLHANALSLMFGLHPEKGLYNLIPFVATRNMNCGVYFASFVLEGLYKTGQDQWAYELLTSKGEHSWYNMLQAGATTCMEAWGPEQKWNTSWCHPWSSAPIFIVAGELMGLKPAEPGWDTIEFAPKPPRNLASARLAISTPKGEIKTAFKQTKDHVTYQLIVPNGSRAKVTLLNVPPDIEIDGKVYTVDKQIKKTVDVYRTVPVSLGPGEHEIIAKRYQE
ncbi:Bacterial alpha-L-rhamnosidase [bacterium]|nr:Bacterial alpha-L-rhamnosidase [bacterium]